MTAFLALVRKDLRVFFGDRRAVIMAFVAPILIGSFFGYVFGPRVVKEQSALKVLFVMGRGFVPFALISQTSSVPSK